MKLTTTHAKMRYQQRGINRLVAEYLVEYGDTNYTPHGAQKITLTKRRRDQIIAALKKEMKKIERASFVTLIEKDGVILTGYHRI